MKRILFLFVFMSGYVLAQVPAGMSDKKFDKVTFAMAHNAASQITANPPLTGLKKASGNSGLIEKFVDIAQKVLPNIPADKKDTLTQILAPNPVADQKMSLEQQLADGIGAFKIPVNLYRNTLYSCHAPLERQIKKLKCSMKEALKKSKLLSISGIPEKLIESMNHLQQNRCLLDETNRPLVDIFRVVNKWLDQNPSEVFTFYLDVGLSSPQRIHHKSEFKKILDESGLAQKLYIHKPNEQWKTIDEMVKSGKRVFIYTDHNDWADLGVYHKDTLGGGSDYSFKTFDALAKDTANPKIDWGKSGDNRLIIVDSYVTPKLAGNEADARKANEYNAVMARLKSYEKIAGQPVNFYMVDFYEQPNKDVIKAIADYNQMHVNKK